jgi:hypothetical protein
MSRTSRCASIWNASNDHDDEPNLNMGISLNVQESSDYNVVNVLCEF